MPQPAKAISIIVPTYNEADNVGLLVNRIDSSLRSAGLQYEIIFIDDHSSDNTRQVLRNLSADFPIRVYLKKGQKGKAFSLLEGFQHARFGTLCMIDADLQYPPEAIAGMFLLMVQGQADMVVTNRIEAQTSRLRKFVSGSFNLLFTRVLFGFRYDTQSGLKLFSKQLADSITVSPTPWSFDLEFIVRSLEKGYRILSYDIPFSERNAGEAKINVISSSVEIGWAALKLRATSSVKDIRRSYRRNVKLAQTVAGITLFIVIGAICLPVKAETTLSVGPVQIGTPSSLQSDGTSMAGVQQASQNYQQAAAQSDQSANGLQSTGVSSSDLNTSSTANNQAVALENSSQSKIDTYVSPTKASSRQKMTNIAVSGIGCVIFIASLMAIIRHAKSKQEPA